MMEKYPDRPLLECQQPGATRDKRYTPSRAIHELFSRGWGPKSAELLDPCCGGGAILRYAADEGFRVYGIDIDPVALQLTQGLLAPTKVELIKADWLEAKPGHAAVAEARQGAPIVTNPPYSIGPSFMRACLTRGRRTYVAALLRLNHLGASNRIRERNWSLIFQDFPPAMLLVFGSWRPSFTADGRTDASEYAWFVWCRQHADLKWDVAASMAKESFGAGSVTQIEVI
jgi:SAM-dependent methyltransferase